MAIPPIPNVGRAFRRYPLAAAQTPVFGAAVHLVAGEVTASAADPAILLGFAMHDYNPTVDIYNGEILVAVALPGSTFWITGSSAPTAANVGEDYGLALSSGLPIIDITDTINIVFNVVAVDTTRNLFEVTVDSSKAQIAN